VAVAEEEEDQVAEDQQAEDQAMEIILDLQEQMHSLTQDQVVAVAVQTLAVQESARLPIG
jgi:hypothetical protein